VESPHRGVARGFQPRAGWPRNRAPRAAATPG